MRQGSRHKLCATSINHATLCHGVTFGTQCAQILVDIPSLKPKVFRFSFITISTKTKAIVQQGNVFCWVIPESTAPSMKKFEQRPVGRRD
ncbi:Hypothetical predicted protein [Paramuricea clavata]|uniref:Uncharacterized protein n=1 Tax=Paramuricea clavata TaxID=317549 RepID=A0A6S7HW90_PARCT|nr:Hypothetical predicted protein [Paramuricea clavata]